MIIMIQNPKFMNINKINPLVHFFGGWPYMFSSSWFVDTLEISGLDTLLPLLQ